VSVREDDDMPRQTIENRVDRLEGQVMELKKLPQRLGGLESQIVQLRTEMRMEFSAVREELRAGDEETRRVLRLDIADVRREMNEKHDEALRLARVLHEEVIGRLALMEEGRPPRRTRKKE
jgi:hypothetical protein